MVDESLSAACISLVSLFIAILMLEGDFNLILGIVFFESKSLNLFQFVNPGVMTG
jgi:hypothetical protein